jgi:flagellar motor switch protein FliN/FliY
MKPAVQDDGIYAADASPTEDLRDAAARNPAVLSLPVTLTVSVGRATLTVEKLLGLDPASILSLDAAIDDPVELLIGERVIARGALVETEDGGGLGVRITELADPPRKG